MAAGRIRWFHSIDLGNGTVTDGRKPFAALKAEADDYFRDDCVKGKTILDIGAWDGFNSFEAERRGASRVVASDKFCWSGPGWGTKAGFEFARETLKSNVEDLEADVFELDPAKHGKFDVVLMAGVIYHLTDPWGGLKRAADLTKELLIVETATALNDFPEPVMRYYLGKELNEDPTNFWAPNYRCLRNILLELGFARVVTELARGRLIARAWR